MASRLPWCIAAALGCSTLGRNELRPMLALLDEGRIHQAVAFYTGESVVPVAPNATIVPVANLWSVRLAD